MFKYMGEKSGMVYTQMFTALFLCCEITSDFLNPHKYYDFCYQKEKVIKELKGIFIFPS